MKLLTSAEIKIAHGISQGFIEKELADRLCVSVHTIHTHTRNIRKKLNARNIADITRHYILSLENPRLVLKALFFLALQLGMVWQDINVDAKRASSSKLVRAKRGGTRNKLKDAYYV